MKEFFVGLLVLGVLLVLTIVGTILLPFIVILGVTLQGVIYLALVIFAVWLVGKVTLMAIEKGKNLK